MTIVQDWDTAENLKYKERLQLLTSEERDILDTLDEPKRNALLKLKDPSVEWNQRYQAGNGLSSEVLMVVAKGNRDFKSVADVILLERSRRS